METVIVTGIAGNLGARLLPQLAGFRVIGIDVAEPPAGAAPARFERMDLGREEATRSLVELLFETQPAALGHLAVVISPLRTGVLQVERQWQINVAGTARGMEAICEYQRRGGAAARQS